MDEIVVIKINFPILIHNFILICYRDKQMPLLEECLRAGKQLIAKKDVTDTHVIRDRMKVRT